MKQIFNWLIYVNMNNLFVIFGTLHKHWLKLKDAPNWKKLTKGTSQTSSGSKRSRNPDGTSQQSDELTHIDINDDLLDLEDEQPHRRSIGRNKSRKATLGSSVIDHFGEKFDRYVQLQESKASMMSWVEQKMIEAQASF